MLLRYDSSNTVIVRRQGAKAMGLSPSVGIWYHNFQRLPVQWLSDQSSQVSPRREIEMRTVGEIEAAISQGVSRFEQDYMGRGPKNIHAHLLGDLLVVRLQGVLTAAEQQLVKTLSGEKGRDLLKQVRTQLIELARPLLESMVHMTTGVEVLSLHHDISTVSAEEVVIFTLALAPGFRETKKK